MARYFRSRLSFARFISYAEVDRAYRDFHDFGEINRNYNGFNVMQEHYVLLMADKDGSCAGLLVFKPKDRGLVEIDILVVKKELRGWGLGRLLYGSFEAGCEDGTALYVERVTDLGRKFFARCGFALDVDYYKVLAEENRIAEPL